MTRLTTLVPVLVALLTAPAAFAQQDDVTTSEGAPLLDTGEPVVEGSPRPDGTYIRETVGDWSIQCLKDQAGKEHCQMYQLLKDPNGNNVAEVNIFRVEGGGQVIAGGTFVVPLETLLTAKLTLSVDGGTAKRYDFAFCNAVGCYARVGFNQEDIDAFKRGAEATMIIVPALAANQRVPVKMSLAGFTKSFDLATPVSNINQ